MNEHDTRFWREIAIGYNQVATNHERQVTVDSEAEDLVAVVMWDEATDSVLVSIMVKTGHRKVVVTDATDRS